MHTLFGITLVLYLLKLSAGKGLMTLYLGILRPSQAKPYLPKIGPTELLETNRENSGLIGLNRVILKSLYEHSNRFQPGQTALINSYSFS